MRQGGLEGWPHATTRALAGWGVRPPTESRVCGLRPPTGLRPSPLRPQAPRPRHRLWATSFARSRSLIPTTSATPRSLPRTYGPSTTGLLCSVFSLKGLRSTYSGHIRTWWTSCERPQYSPDDPSAPSTSPPESAAEAPRLNQISAKSDCIDLGRTAPVFCWSLQTVSTVCTHVDAVAWFTLCTAFRQTCASVHLPLELSFDLLDLAVGRIGRLLGL